MKRRYTDEIQEVQRTVKKMNSLIKLPKLNEKEAAIKSVAQIKNIISDGQKSSINSNTKIFISKKLTPLQNKSKDNKKSTSFLNNKSQDALTILKKHQQRVTSSKLPEQISFLNKKQSYSQRFNGALQNTLEQIYPNEIIISIKDFFKRFLKKQIIQQLIFPTIYTIKIKEFHPFWEAIDTMLLTFPKLYYSKADILKQIFLVYSCMSSQLIQIRRLIFQNAEKIGKKELETIILQALLLETLFIYSILSFLVWKQPMKILQQFIYQKIQVILKIRKSLLEIFLCDVSRKQQMKANNKITKFVLIKQRLILELGKTVEKLFWQFFKTIGQLDSKFMLLNVQKVQNFNEFLNVEQKLKSKILQVPTKPYLTQQIDLSKYTLIIEPQNFLYKQNKQLSLFVLRQGSIEFLKSISPYYNLIAYSRLSQSQLKCYISYAENNGIVFDAILDKKYLGYNKLTLQKKIQNIGLKNLQKNTVVIDTNYRDLIANSYRYLCLPVSQDGVWSNSSYLQRLGSALINIFQKKEEVQMTSFQV